MEPPVCEICCPNHFKRSVSTLTITLTPLGVSSTLHSDTNANSVDPDLQVTRLVNHVSFVGKFIIDDILIFYVFSHSI